MSFSAALCKDMFARDDTDDMILAAVSKDGMLLRRVRRQTFAICKAAVEQNWRAIAFVQDLHYSILQVALQCNLEAASLLPPQVHTLAVAIDLRAFDFIAKPTMACCEYVIKKMPEWITKRPNPPMNLCLLAVQGRFEDASFRAYANSPYHEPVQYLRRDYLEGMPVTEELQKAALAPTKGGAILSYSQAAQERLAEEAVRLNVKVYSYMPESCHTVALDRIVCTAYPEKLAQIPHPARDLVWDIAKRWAPAIKYAEEQDEALCIHAVRHQSSAIAYVRRNRLHIWAKAGHKTIPSLTTLFPEFATLMTRSASARAFFHKINVALHRRAPLKADEEVLEDPVTMDPVVAGTVCAFLPDGKGNQHFAGTLDSLLDLLKAGFHGSTVQHLFIPIKNALVPTQQIKWRQI